MSHSIRYTFAIVAISMLLTSCTGPKADAIVIVDESGRMQVRGQISFERDSRTGALQPQMWKPGNLFFFRGAHTKPGGFTAKSGIVYRVGKNAALEEVGTFDTTLTAEALVGKYLRR